MLQAPLQKTRVSGAAITALAVVDDGAPLIITGRDDGTISSVTVDGSSGPLHVSRAHSREITALAVLKDSDGPMIISGGDDRALRSWRLDGAPGPLEELNAHRGGVRALASVEQDGVIVSGGGDGALRTWRVHGTLVALESSTARDVEVRQLSLGSLDIVVHLPADVLTAIAGGVGGFTLFKLRAILDGIELLAGFPARLRIKDADLKADLLYAQARIEDAHVSQARARQRRSQLEAAGFEVDHTTVADDDEPLL